MSDTLRDRIARALVKSDCDRHCCDLTWDQTTPEGKEAARNDADAVLAVLRNPTDEDVERAAKAEYEADCGMQGLDWIDDTDKEERSQWRSTWRAGLTAFLGGGEA